MRRVVVTGMGIVSSLGHAVPDAFNRLKIPQNCVKVSESLDEYKGLQTRLCAPAGYVKPERYNRKVTRTMGPVSVMALDASEQALAQAGLVGDEVLKSGRTGIAYGSSSGSVDALADFYTIIFSKEVKNVTSSTYIKMMPQTTCVNLSVHFGTTGRIVPTGTACTSGSLAIGSAYELIKYGKQDVMIAGGAEEFSPTQVAVFDTLFATSNKNDSPQDTPRAFDCDRDGLVIGEGAATMILEEREHALRRGAHIIAEIVGFGTNTDGRHVTQPNHETMALAMKYALDDAVLDASRIGYINAHGTATDLGDVAEATASAAVYGTDTPISTIKNYTGHTLGACGAIEAVMTVEMMRAGWFAPNLNLANPDPACCGLDFITGNGRSFDVEFASSNNFAFGGVNTSLIFKRV